MDSIEKIKSTIEAAETWLCDEQHLWETFPAHHDIHTTTHNLVYELYNQFRNLYDKVVVLEHGAPLKDGDWVEYQFIEQGGGHVETLLYNADVWGQLRMNKRQIRCIAKRDGKPVIYVGKNDSKNNGCDSSRNS